jgi:hypothetical protein
VNYRETDTVNRKRGLGFQAPNCERIYAPRIYFTANILQFCSSTRIRTSLQHDRHDPTMLLRRKCLVSSYLVALSRLSYHRLPMHIFIVFTLRTIILHQYWDITATSLQLSRLSLRYTSKYSRLCTLQQRVSDNIYDISRERSNLLIIAVKSFTSFPSARSWEKLLSGSWLH